MTDPVNTDALRNLVRLLLDGPAADTPAETWAIIHQVRRHLFEAAAEIDRLRERLADAEDFARSVGLDASEGVATIDRLRAAIDNAPHADACAARLSSHAAQPWPCTCWKADAL